MVDRLKYWLSDEGMNEFEKCLEMHFSGFLQEHEYIRQPLGYIPEIPAEVIVVKSHPNDGRQTLVTMGLTGFILADPDQGGYCRQEFAITALDDQIENICLPLLTAVVNYTLASARYLKEMTALDSASIPGEINLGQNAVIVPFLGIWLPPTITYIDSEIPAYVTEVAVLDRSEYELLTDNFNEFKRRTEESNVDYTDFRRLLTVARGQIPP